MGQRLGIPKNDWSIETFFVGNQRSGLKEAHTDVYVQSMEQGELMRTLRSQIAGNKNNYYNDGNLCPFTHLVTQMSTWWIIVDHRGCRDDCRRHEGRGAEALRC